MSDLDQARQAINEADREIARLFEKRMDAVRQVAEYKKEHGIPVEDTAREEQIIRENSAYIENDEYRSYYVDFLRSAIDLSKSMQHRMLDEKRGAEDASLSVKTAQGDYDVSIERGSLHRAGEFFNLNRKVLVVSDSGVPEQYAMTVASQCDEAVLFVFEQGEASKCMNTYVGILQTLTDNAFTRADCVVAVGGGVVGDIAGFAAATYMRGIDFYNVPTTVLAQVDSSIGGKTAVNFGSYKNSVGAFYPPKGVLIDSDVLTTLPKRQIANGLAEIVKMALTHDAELFAALETADSVPDAIMLSALKVKKQVVEADEHEDGLRKVLNFGHTLGHAIESVSDYYHGECVALGMIPMCAPAVREKLLNVLKRFGLPTEYRGDADALIEACRHDKKMAGDTIAVVYVPAIGSFEIKQIPFSEYEVMVREVMGE